MRVSRIAITILSLIVCVNLNAQKKNSYYTLIQKGDSLYYHNNYSEAYKYYSAAVHLKKYIAISDILQFIDCAMNLNKQKDCYKLYKLAILNGCPIESLERMLKSESCSINGSGGVLESDNTLKQKYIDRLLKKYHSLNKKYISRLNLDVQNKLYEIEGYDQGLRWAYIYFKDSIIKKKYDSLYNKIVNREDSNNFNYLVDLTKRYGWLNYKQVGTATSTVELLLWHQRGNYCETENWKYMKEIILKQIVIGELEPDYLIPYEDYAYYKKNKMQLYGTMVNNYDGELKYFPIFDIKNVDKRRKEVGLEDLKTNSLKRKAILPSDYINN